MESSPLVLSRFAGTTMRLMVRTVERVLGDGLGTEAGPDGDEAISSEVHTRNAVPYGQRHAVRCEAVTRPDDGRGDLRVPLPANHDDLVAHAGIRGRREVDPRVFERRARDDGDGAPAH